MKVVIVNASDVDGGAARAAYRLHRSLLGCGIDSKMVVQTKKSDDFTVIGPQSKIAKVVNRIRPFLDTIPVRLFSSLSTTLFSTSWFPSRQLIKEINALRPDIVHLHWINGGMIRIEDLAKINSPLVWSLHDMWPLRGGWHYNEALADDKQIRLSKRIFKRKLNTYSKVKSLTIVGLSRWLQESAQNSCLFREKKIVNLPNPINTQVYKKFDKRVLRELWGLPKSKKLILFGAMGATSDPRKGFKELTAALSDLQREDVELIVFGSTIPLTPPRFKCKVHYIGTISDDISLVTIYNSVDVVLVPSLQENLSNVILESLACGTPVVAFNIGGNSDLIDHKVSGYLAQPFDTDDLAAGLMWILDHKEYQVLSKNARDKAVGQFDSEIVAKNYIALYEEIING